jgi:hypothetical protein
VKISEAAFYSWRAKCSGLLSSKVKHPRQFTGDYGKLKKQTSHTFLVGDQNG